MEEFKKMHMSIIYEVLTQAEREEMAFNMANNSKHEPNQIHRLVKEYLSNNIYIPCSNPELIKKFNREDISSAEKKGIAFEQCIKKNLRTFARYHGASFMKNKYMSIGFSDDSKKNVDAIRDIINQKLKEKYPKMIFYLYDTADPSEIKKEIIT